MGELDERGTAPGVDDPVWGFEVLFAAEGAEGFEVLRLQEEGVGELVTVDEEGRRKGEVGVESAGGLRWGEGAGGESEVEFGMEACWVLERGCDGELRGGGRKRVVARGEGEHRRAWMGLLA